ncbi:ABC peptide transporter, periplasmic ligand binding protein [Candidatus Koribacter versatilis Ellin345]|uniref:ABC peptide transporter, periplasmic ligand binding protein n=1 Tax=Koribacter versatilis (strain Ellin345) TaxID=204669 RepID=Q1IQW7_KORVE|nr:ABC transporter substrate-binding protein [Candidatus Koribacter versatilis]ABF40733.1 ABC peptide transporter, periplasmic ligand binding protein [Candidatus Koribacter versatilis Ellin345]
MKRTTFLLLVISSVLLTSLGFARTRPRQGGTLRVEMRAEASQWMNSAVRMLVFDSLTQMDDSGHVGPALAVRWDSQSDDRRWQFWLRPDVRFHDGTPLSAATVVQSLTAQACVGCPWRSVHVSGDSVVFESETPVPQLPALLANSRYAVGRRDESGNLVGTGPFRFAAMVNGAATLSAVEDSSRGRPYVNAIEVRGQRSLRDQWMDVSVGRADVVEVPAELLRRAQQEHMRLLISRDVDLIALVIDDSDSAVRDARVREALALSIDRGALFNVVFQKQGEVTASLLPNWLSGYSFAFLSTPNLSKAKELRSQLDKPADLTLSVEGGDPVLQLIADRVALNTKDAGLTVRALSTPGRSTLRLLRLHVEETMPGAAYVTLTGQLAQGERSPAEDVVAVFHQEQELLAKRTVVPLLYTPRSVAYAPRVHDLALSPDGGLRMADFWLEDAK